MSQSPRLSQSPPRRLSTTSSTHRLLNIPTDIQARRLALFEIQNVITLSPPEYEEIWPYVDNIWSRQFHDKIIRKGQRSDLYRCRLFRKQATTRGDGKRSRPILLAKECKMRLKVVEIYQENVIEKVCYLDLFF